MPSSLIIVGLAAAWLVVLVPMIARKRQVITQTNDSALAARVVRSGSTRSERRKEFAVSADAKPGSAQTAEDDDLIDSEYDDSHYDDDLDDLDDDYEDYEDYEEPEEPSRAGRRHDADHADSVEYEDYDDERTPRRYRPGRGGFDPEAAEIAARAKYAFRQRVVLGLLFAVVVTAVVAGFVMPVVWWLNGLVDIGLIGYLGYLRRQVRIENEIRQRRLARYNNASATARRTPRPPAEPLQDVKVHPIGRRDLAGVERKPVPRMRRNAVVVDVEDEDPAFHELDDPGQLPYRRAAGE
ncbi:gephyrin-like molybdotransferase receptor GlpR [Saccharomonospora sp. NPDC006951]